MGVLAGITRSPPASGGGKAAPNFFLVLLLQVPLLAHAGLSGDINKLRSKGCSQNAGVGTALRASRALDAVAQQWSRGGRLREALDRTEYRAADSASMRVTGTSSDAAIMKVLAQNYCDTVTSRAFTEIGMYRRNDAVWIVVATPLSMPGIKDRRQVSHQVLNLVNAARSKPRRCGSQSYPAVGPLRLSAMLTQAALVQAQDMSAHEHFEHEGTDGSTPAQRITRTGYQWLNVGENIAAGAASADEVVNGWLSSPGHCKNIMTAAFTEMGIAYVAGPKTRPGIYWSQVFGRPRSAK